MNVEKKLRELFCKETGCDESEVIRSAMLSDDLGFDSLDEIEIVMAAEESFAIEIPDEETYSLRTFGDCVDYIEKRLSVTKEGR